MNGWEKKTLQYPKWTEGPIYFDGRSPEWKREKNLSTPSLRTSSMAALCAPSRWLIISPFYFLPGHFIQPTASSKRLDRSGNVRAQCLTVVASWIFLPALFALIDLFPSCFTNCLRWRKTKQRKPGDDCHKTQLSWVSVPDYVGPRQNRKKSLNPDEGQCKLIKVSGALWNLVRVSRECATSAECQSWTAWRNRARRNRIWSGAVSCRVHCDGIVEPL